MSTRHKSAKIRPTRQKTMDTGSENLVQNIKSNLMQIDDMLNDRPNQWESYLAPARTAIAALDRIHFFRHSERLAEQIWIIQILQDYAYRDADSGGIRDIADWCQRSWLRILRDHADNVDILAGLGENWLQRSQASLARIHGEEGGGSTNITNPETTSDVAQRLQTPPYVEARGFLQPAVDFLSRAVDAGDRNDSLTGDLLGRAAEACMSLGNVSPTSTAQEYFGRAVRYLRRAEAIPGYTLSVYLQEYLESYGRYVN